MKSKVKAKRSPKKHTSRVLPLPGFEAPLAALMKDPCPIGTLRDLLLLVSYRVPESELRKKTPRERAHAHLYASRAYAQASDNVVRLPPLPEWLPPFEERSDDPARPLSIWG